MRYPNPCVKCGFCCLAERCPAAERAFGESKEVCPMLSFEEDVAECGMVEVLGKEVMGIGEGCCIKARVLTRTGKVIAFASMPKESKIMAARMTREKSITVYSKERRTGKYAKRE